MSEVVIQRFVLEFKGQSQDSISKFEQRYKEILLTAVCRSLEKHIAKLLKSSEVYKVDRLEIDLNFPIENIETEVLRQLKEQQNKFVLAGDENINGLSLSQRNKQIANAYLQKGYLPWNAMQTNSINLKSVIEEGFLKSITDEELNAVLLNEIARTRLIEFLKDDFAEAVLKKSGINEPAKLLQLFSDIEDLFKINKLAFPREHIWQRFLHVLLNPEFKLSIQSNIDSLVFFVISEVALIQNKNITEIAESLVSASTSKHKAFGKMIKHLLSADLVAGSHETNKTKTYHEHYKTIIGIDASVWQKFSSTLPSYTVKFSLLNYLNEGSFKQYFIQLRMLFLESGLRIWQSVIDTAMLSALYHIYIEKEGFKKPNFESLTAHFIAHLAFKASIVQSMLWKEFLNKKVAYNLLADIQVSELPDTRNQQKAAQNQEQKLLHYPVRFFTKADALLIALSKYFEIDIAENGQLQELTKTGLNNELLNVFWQRHINADKPEQLERLVNRVSTSMEIKHLLLSIPLPYKSRFLNEFFRTSDFKIDFSVQVFITKAFDELVHVVFPEMQKQGIYSSEEIVHYMQTNKSFTNKLNVLMVWLTKKKQGAKQTQRLTTDLLIDNLYAFLHMQKEPDHAFLSTLFDAADKEDVITAFKSPRLKKLLASKYIDQALWKQLIDKLKLKYGAKFEERVRLPETDDGLQSADSNKSTLLNEFYFFLQWGYLPWYSANINLSSWKSDVLLLLKRKAFSYYALQNELGQFISRIRLYNLFGNTDLLAIFQLIITESNRKFLEKLFNLMDHLAGKIDADNSHAIRLILFEELFRAEHSGEQLQWPSVLVLIEKFLQNHTNLSMVDMKLPRLIYEKQGPEYSKQDFEKNQILVFVKKWLANATKGSLDKNLITEFSILFDDEPYYESFTKDVLAWLFRQINKHGIFKESTYVKKFLASAKESLNADMLEIIEQSIQQLSFTTHTNAETDNFNTYKLWLLNFKKGQSVLHALVYKFANRLLNDEPTQFGYFINEITHFNKGINVNKLESLNYHYNSDYETAFKAWATCFYEIDIAAKALLSEELYFNLVKMLLWLNEMHFVALNYKSGVLWFFNFVLANIKIPIHGKEFKKLLKKEEFTLLADHLRASQEYAIEKPYDLLLSINDNLEFAELFLTAHIKFKQIALVSNDNELIISYLNKLQELETDGRLIALLQLVKTSERPTLLKVLKEIIGDLEFIRVKLNLTKANKQINELKRNLKTIITKASSRDILALFINYFVSRKEQTKFIQSILNTSESIDALIVNFFHAKQLAAFRAKSEANALDKWQTLKTQLQQSLPALEKVLANWLILVIQPVSEKHSPLADYMLAQTINKLKEAFHFSVKSVSLKRAKQRYSEIDSFIGLLFGFATDLIFYYSTITLKKEQRLKDITATGIYGFNALAYQTDYLSHFVASTTKSQAEASLKIAEIKEFAVAHGLPYLTEAITVIENKVSYGTYEKSVIIIPDNEKMEGSLWRTLAEQVQEKLRKLALTPTTKTAVNLPVSSHTFYHWFYNEISFFSPDQVQLLAKHLSQSRHARLKTIANKLLDAVSYNAKPVYDPKQLEILKVKSSLLNALDILKKEFLVLLPESKHQRLKFTFSELRLRILKEKSAENLKYHQLFSIIEEVLSFAKVKSLQSILKKEAGKLPFLETVQFKLLEQTQQENIDALIQPISDFFLEKTVADEGGFTIKEVMHAEIEDRHHQVGFTRLLKAELELLMGVHEAGRELFASFIRISTKLIKKPPSNLVSLFNSMADYFALASKNHLEQMYGFLESTKLDQSANLPLFTLMASKVLFNKQVTESIILFEILSTPSSKLTNYEPLLVADRILLSELNYLLRHKQTQSDNAFIELLKTIIFADNKVQFESLFNELLDGVSTALKTRFLSHSDFLFQYMNQIFNTTGFVTGTDSTPFEKQKLLHLLLDFASIMVPSELNELYKELPNAKFLTHKQQVVYVLNFIAKSSDHSFFSLLNNVANFLKNRGEYAYNYMLEGLISDAQKKTFKSAVVEVKTDSFNQIKDLEDSDEVEALINKLAQNKQDWAKEIREGEKIYALNVGVIIFWPFIEKMFQKLGYIEEKKFINFRLQERAVYLLHYLATGDECESEHLLALNKLICGLKITEPLISRVVLTDDEKNECDLLISSVISHWKVISNSSAEAVRETFIKREGILYLKDRDWNLKVEAKAVDRLLSKIPWGFSTIKLPWNKYIIFAEWI